MAKSGVKAKAALERIRKAASSSGTDKMSTAEIDRIIAEVRKSKKPRTRG